MQYLIHIGYPRAASSFLQSTLFSGQSGKFKPLNMDGRAFVGYQKSGAGVFSKTGYNSYLNPFEFSAEEARKQIQDNVNSAAEVTVLSNEFWGGHPLSGGITAKEYANRIHATVPEAKILIVVRNQVDAILSVYADYLTRSNGAGTLKHFLQNNQHTQAPFHNLSYYRYDLLAEYYVSLFGKENVLILPFEILAEQGEKTFLQAVSDFIKIKENIDFKSAVRNEANYKSYYLLKRMPALNVFSKVGPVHSHTLPAHSYIRELVLSAGQVFVSNKKIAADRQADAALIKTALGTEIRESNRRLQQYVSYDIKKLGYITD